MQFTAPINILNESYELKQSVEPPALTSADADNGSRAGGKKAKQSEATQPKGETGRPKQIPPKDPAEIKKRLAAIDPEEFKADFPHVDVHAVFAKYQDVCIHGTGQKPEPNPYNYRGDFRAGFRSWLRRESQSNGQGHKSQFKDLAPDQAVDLTAVRNPIPRLRQEKMP